MTVWLLSICILYGFLVMLLYSVLSSQGQPAELSSKFIRYSTFKLGKEQLVRNHLLLIIIFMEEKECPIATEVS